MVKVPIAISQKKSCNCSRFQVTVRLQFQATLPLRNTAIAGIINWANIAILQNTDTRTKAILQNTDTQTERRKVAK